MPLAFGHKSPLKVYTFYVPSKFSLDFESRIKGLRNFNNYLGDEDYMTRKSVKEAGQLFAFVTDDHLERDMLELSRENDVICSISRVKNQQKIDKTFLQKAIDFVDTGYSEWLEKHQKQPKPAQHFSDDRISPLSN